ERGVSKMMAREPGRRSQTAAAVAAALEPFCAAAGPVPARRDPPAAVSKESVKAGGPVTDTRNTPLPPQKAQRAKTADSPFDFPGGPAKESPKRPVARRSSKKTRGTGRRGALLAVVAAGGLGAAGRWFLWLETHKDEASGESGHVAQADVQAKLPPAKIEPKPTPEAKAEEAPAKPGVDAPEKVKPPQQPTP